VYQGVIPIPVRSRVWRARRQIVGGAHELRWRMTPEPLLSQWVDRRLDSSPYYWLFIMGCNNSGTSLLSEVLGADPRMRTLPKGGQRLTDAIPDSARAGVGRIFTQRLDLFRWTEASPADPVRRLRYDWARYFSQGPGILLEKSTPNAVRSRWLQKHFRPARFVTIVRNPYAVSEGIARRTPHPIEEGARHWTRLHAILREDMKYLEQCLVVTYEDFCDRPTEQLERIRQFLGLAEPFDVSILERSFNAPNIDGKPAGLQNLNNRSFSRLNADAIATITRIAGEEMTHWGYAPL
jgi:hypothetical protein